MVCRSTAQLMLVLILPPCGWIRLETGCVLWRVFLFGGGILFYFIFYFVLFFILFIYLLGGGFSLFLVLSAGSRF